MYGENTPTHASATAKVNLRVRIYRNQYIPTRPMASGNHHCQASPRDGLRK